MSADQFVSAQAKAKPKGKGRIRHVPGQMNKTEAAYAEHLALLLRAGDILWWKFEAVTLKLAPDLRWTPDFLVMLGDGSLELHDTKGHMELHARAKMLVVAHTWPFVVRVVKRAGGGWEVKEA